MQGQEVPSHNADGFYKDCRFPKRIAKKQKSHWLKAAGAFAATKRVFSNTKINLEIKDKLTLNSLAVFVTRKSIS